MSDPILKIEVFHDQRDARMLFAQVNDSTGTWWTKKHDCWAAVLDEVISRLERRGPDL